MCVSFCSMMDYCVELITVDDHFCEYCSNFMLKLFQSTFLLGNVLLRGELKFTDATKSNFENFESALYMKSGSVPLRSLLFVCISLVYIEYCFVGTWCYVEIKLPYVSAKLPILVGPKVFFASLYPCKQNLSWFHFFQMRLRRPF